MPRLRQPVDETVVADAEPLFAEPSAEIDEAVAAEPVAEVEAADIEPLAAEGRDQSLPRPPRATSPARRPRSPRGLRPGAQPLPPSMPPTTTRALARSPLSRAACSVDSAPARTSTRSSTRTNRTRSPLRLPTTPTPNRSPRRPWSRLLSPPMSPRSRPKPPKPSSRSRSCRSIRAGGRARSRGRNHRGDRARGPWGDRARSRGRGRAPRGGRARSRDRGRARGRCGGRVEPEAAIEVEPEAVAAARGRRAAVEVEPGGRRRASNPNRVAAELAAEPDPTPAPEPVDLIQQPTWRMVAPDPTIEQPATPPISPSIPAAATAPDPNAEPQWPTRASAAPSVGLPFLNRPAAATGGLEALWAESARDVVDPPTIGGRPVATGGIQPCVSCGLSLSATARFCRRCGTPQAV